MSDLMTAATVGQLLGLDRSTVYRMAANPYLQQGQSTDDREPIFPHASFATGANELSTLDMAAGIQTTPLSHQEVIDAGREAEPVISSLLARVIGAL